MLLTKARNTSLVNLASWSTTSASGNPAPDRRHMSRMITAASVAVAVKRVGTACTLPDSRWTWFWIMSKAADVVGSPAILSTPIIPPRCPGGGRGWRSPRGPPCSALVRWHVWHERTYSATSQSWRCRGAPVRAARRRRGCRGGPQRPVCGGRAGSSTGPSTGVAALSGNSERARAMNILVHGWGNPGVNPHPPRAVWRGVRPPP